MVSSLHHYVLSLGANLGARAAQMLTGVRSLEAEGVEVLRWSRLYETAPVGVLDQPSFLNAAVWCRSPHGPRDLLALLKRIEREGAGRDSNGQRWGPRPLDMDMIAFDGQRVDFKEDGALPALEVPHPRWFERDFVLAPISELVDVAAGSRDLDVIDIASGRLRTVGSPVEGVSFGSRDERLGAAGVVRFLSRAKELWSATRAHRRAMDTARTENGLCSSPPSAWPVLPLSFIRDDGHGGGGADPTWAWNRQGPRVMGILNATPDSFSDGGRHGSTQDFVLQARQMVGDGAAVLDVGGQSTRPGASRLTADEESARVLPVIEALRSDPEISRSGALISVDTFYARVAREAVRRGADFINDVSGGLLDAEMHSIVGSLGVPYVIMHMRGDPSNMQLADASTYTDVTAESACELAMQCSRAVAHGVAPWSLILDPGIGFAKTKRGNEQLIREVGQYRERFKAFGGLAAAPVLVGLSRKGFLGSITGHADPSARDSATAAANLVSYGYGSDIFRVHAVRATVDALKVADALHAYGP